MKKIPFLISLVLSLGLGLALGFSLEKKGRLFILSPAKSAKAATSSSTLFWSAKQKRDKAKKQPPFAEQQKN